MVFVSHKRFLSLAQCACAPGVPKQGQAVHWANGINSLEHEKVDCPGAEGHLATA